MSELPSAANAIASDGEASVVRRRTLILTLLSPYLSCVGCLFPLSALIPFAISSGYLASSTSDPKTLCIAEEAERIAERSPAWQTFNQAIVFACALLAGAAGVQLWRLRLVGVWLVMVWLVLHSAPQLTSALFLLDDSALAKDVDPQLLRESVGLQAGAAILITAPVAPYLRRPAKRGLLGSAHITPRADPGGGSSRVASRDGTVIAIECAGSGPDLVIVHGGIGDRTRWTPMFPLLSSHFTVCAIDRRGHGASGDSPDYSLAKEAEDVAAVVESRPGPVFLLGHSYGGVVALEAAFLTTHIAKLVLYEPPLQDHIDLSVVDRIETLLEGGAGDQAVETFLREIVKLPPAEVAAMRSRPTWPKFVAGIGSQPRELRTLAAYRFDAQRTATLQLPTLLVTGADTASPQLKEAIRSLQSSLPDPTLVVLEGQQHNAMDNGRPQLAEAVSKFLLSDAPSSSRSSGDP